MQDEPRVLDRASQTLFVDLAEGGALPAGTSARDAVAAALCTLAHGLGVEPARDLEGALPEGLRSLLRRGAGHRLEPQEPFDRRAYLALVARTLAMTEGQAESLARAVFAALHAQIPRAVVDDVASQLPADLRDLWLRPGR
jgi:uncharacterized protein (DUF2267 family)